MPDESTYLAWSKTIEGVKFRCFAFTAGCDDPDCPGCAALEGEPVWAVFQRPRPSETENQHDEWCLTLIGYGPILERDAGEDRPPLVEVLADLEVVDEDQQEFWRRVAALIGAEWKQIIKSPYEYAVKHTEALEQLRAPGVVKTMMDVATPDQLREVRRAQRTDAATFGIAFARLWWDVIKKQAAASRRRRRGH